LTNASFINDNDTNVLPQHPFFNLATNIFNVYSDAVRQNVEELTVSSAKIIQEQTIRAWTNAAQSCSKALAKNAMFSQQQSIERIIEANKKAFGIFAVDLSPFKMQPMAGVANWLPTMWLPTRTNASSKAPSPKLGKSSSPKRARRRTQ
jgi:hypothetical protein